MAAAVRRVRYLLARARALDTASLIAAAKRAAGRHRRPWPLLLADMLYCAVVHECAFQDYQDWDFDLLTRAERRTFMTHPKSNHIALRWNDRQRRGLLEDKRRFVARFADYIGRATLDLGTADADALREFALRHGEIVAKVPDSLGGYGIERHLAASIADWPAFHAALVAKRQLLVEEVIAQHDAMASLNPSSVNTVRLITFLRDDRVHLLAAVLKIGDGGDTDNFSSGGMYTMLDDDGVVHHPAFDGAGAVHTVHPSSGASIVGFRVPQFAALRDLVERAAREVPEVPYVGWDVAVTPDGGVLVEGNYNTGVFQAKPSASGLRHGLLPRYREVIGF